MESLQSKDVTSKARMMDQAWFSISLRGSSGEDADRHLSSDLYIEIRASCTMYNEVGRCNNSDWVFGILRDPQNEIK